MVYSKKEFDIHPRYCSIENSGNIKASLSLIRIESLFARRISEPKFPHRHDYYTFMIVKHGSGWHEIDGHCYKVNHEEIFIIRPGQVHSWELSETIQGYIVEFKREALDYNIPICSELINQLHSINDVLPIDPQLLRYLNSICEVMYEEMTATKEGYDICLQSCMTSLLVLITRLADRKHIRRVIPQDLSDRFLNLVNIYYAKEHGVDFYAKQLGISAKALTAIIGRTRSKSPRQLIQQRFLLEAKRLLTYSQLSIAEIAFAVGFEDPNYFSRFFRSQENITPAEFRATSHISTKQRRS